MFINEFSRCLRNGYEHSLAPKNGSEIVFYWDLKKTPLVSVFTNKDIMAQTAPITYATLLIKTCILMTSERFLTLFNIAKIPNALNIAVLMFLPNIFA